MNGGTRKMLEEQYNQLLERAKGECTNSEYALLCLAMNDTLSHLTSLKRSEKRLEQLINLGLASVAQTPEAQHHSPTDTD